jgi:hypothetical protein
MVSSYQRTAIKPKFDTETHDSLKQSADFVLVNNKIVINEGKQVVARFYTKQDSIRFTMRKLRIKRRSP